MDSIYFYDANSLFVNLFTPSVLNWSQRGLTVTQSTSFPTSGTSTIKITGSSSNSNFALKVRIPSWAAGASVTVNGAAASASVTPGSYASISRTWASGDTVVVTLPMKFRVLPANDNKTLAAVAYGPTVLVGNYGSQAVSSAPTLALNTLQRTSSTSLSFSATAGGKSIVLQPFFDGQGFNYVTYFSVTGAVPK
ncbi:secreted protein [Phlyctema vagabunda]|uniref:Secreted protein n=1 Tax=Phlyctema vagabunda TaxID=108571 RepID=A0ABR4PGB2_9HELO